jgi:dynein heavy chain
MKKVFVKKNVLKNCTFKQY